MDSMAMWIAWKGMEGTTGAPRDIAGINDSRLIVKWLKAEVVRLNYVFVCRLKHLNWHRIWYLPIGCVEGTQLKHRLMCCGTDCWLSLTCGLPEPKLCSFCWKIFVISTQVNRFCFCCWPKALSLARAEPNREWQLKGHRCKGKLCPGFTTQHNTKQGLQYKM